MTWAALLLLSACGSSTAPSEPATLVAAEPPEAPTYPPTAKVEVWEELQADLQAERHVSDGGGAVRLLEGEPVMAGTPGRWTLLYEAGEHGIAEGGRLIFQAPPFWGWSDPQTELPSAPGYTTVQTDAAGIHLDAVALGQGMLSVAVRGRALAAGEQVRITYGAGELGSVADRFAERGTPLWLAVDGDGDGVRALVRDLPTVDVLPRPPKRLILTLPTVAHPGDSVLLRIAAVDEAGNAGHPASLELSLEAADGLGVPRTVRLAPSDAGTLALPVRADQSGVFTVQALGPDGLVGRSNPMLVRQGAERVLWGDLQVHSGLSDGTGRPADVYRYARDVAGLDVAAVTDHDHWGMRFLDQHPELWDEVVQAAHDAYEPGRFVTAVGFEWTSWLYGHRHVLYFDDSAELLSNVDPRWDTPEELWAALRGRDAITIAHHSAGGPVAVDWSIPPDPELEPVTEICSVHGQSEAPDAPGAIYQPVAGAFVRDQLVERGYRLGFIGSTDGHDGHPGLSHLTAPSGGLAAILTDDVSRRGVLEALRARRVYATNGVRMLLRVSVGGAPMGAVVPEGSEVPVEVRVLGTAPVVRIDLVGREGVVGSARPDSAVAHRTWTLSELRAGDFVYVRALQADGGMAWSSPVFVDATR